MMRMRAYKDSGVPAGRTGYQIDLPKGFLEELMGEMSRKPGMSIEGHANCIVDLLAKDGKVDGDPEIIKWDGDVTSEDWQKFGDRLCRRGGLVG